MPYRQKQVVSLTPTLTWSARNAGLRNGDPISLMLTSRTQNSTRSGLIVPGRVGEMMKATIPRDDYSIAAFGSKGTSLFQRQDPYIAVGGTNTQGLFTNLALPL